MCRTTLGIEIRLYICRWENGDFSVVGIISIMNKTRRVLNAPIPTADCPLPTAY
jgi:hypothetical protein